MTSKRTNKLRSDLEKLYQDRSKDLLFHGWHHIHLTAKKAVEFAQELKVDPEVVEAAALTHDLNYLIEPYSKPDVGQAIRAKYLEEAGFTENEQTKIEEIIRESNTGIRDNQISDEAKALSDADTIFKALPITPILFAGHYLTENRVDIIELANKIVNDQKPLFDSGIYFYTNSAKQKYLAWAEINLKLWESVQESLKDPDVLEVINIARSLGAIK